MTNANDSAFTYSEVSWNKDAEEYNSTEHSGLSKREYFAAMALQGLLTKYSLNNQSDQQVISQMAVELADSLIKELNA